MAREATPRLIEHLSSPSVEVRVDAIEALEFFGEDAAQAVPALRACLREPERSVRIAAVSALAEMPQAAAPAASELVGLAKVASTEEDLIAVLEALGNFDAPSVFEALIAAAGDARRAVRAEALSAFALAYERAADAEEPARGVEADRALIALGETLVSALGR